MKWSLVYRWFSIGILLSTNFLAQELRVPLMLVAVLSGLWEISERIAEGK